MRRLLAPRYDRKPLYLDTQGLKIGRSGEVLTVKEKEKTIQDVRIHEICQVNLLGNIQITTPGARVRPGEVILELLPTQGQQVLEAKLLPADIAHVRAGTRAAVKLDAFDYTVHGVLQGVVTYVSPDALQERTAQGDESFYRVLVEVDRAHLEQRNRQAPTRPIQLQAGMFATVEFIVGEHTVLHYLAKPLLRTAGDALGER